jgi:hypothetical protein
VLVISRFIAALAYAGAAFLFGLAIGERGELGAVQYVFWIVIPIGTVVLVVGAREGGLEIMFTGLLMFAGVWNGNYAFAKAFDECVTAGPFVRDALVRHQQRTGDYPRHLKELDITLPCGCILRDTILHYNSSDRGFNLWITNDAKTLQFGARRATAI